MNALVNEVQKKLQQVFALRSPIRNVDFIFRRAQMRTNRYIQNDSNGILSRHGADDYEITWIIWQFPMKLVSETTLAYMSVVLILFFWTFQGLNIYPMN